MTERDGGMVDWRADERKYSVGRIGFLGSIHIATAGYDGTGSREDANKYRWSTNLPLASRTLGKCATQQEAEALAEFAVHDWLRRAALSRTKENG